MKADLSKPLLKLDQPEPGQKLPGHGGPKPARTLTAAQQSSALGPSFDRLRTVMAQANPAMELAADPAGLAPERLLVLEVTGSITDFAKAVARVQGNLQFVGEEMLDPDELDDDPQVYLLVPDLQALGNILALWDRWQQGMPMQTGFAPWRHLFEHLRDIRPWGPADRVRPADQSLLADLVDGVPDGELVRLECELVFRNSAAAAAAGEAAVLARVAELGGAVIQIARHPEFAYHGVLLDLPASQVRSIVVLDPGGLAGLEPLQSIYPQSLGTSIELGDSYPVAQAGAPQILDAPIAAVLDAVPLQAHPWLAPWLDVVDPYGLDAISVGRRVHGTAMASIVIHGDRVAPESISKRIYFRSVMYAPAAGVFGASTERFMEGRLIVDVMAESIATMKQDGGQNVVIVNISLGDANKRFSSRLSSWARALDYLAYQHGLLFIVSAGNIPDHTPIATFGGSIELENATEAQRSSAVVRALNALKADRRLLSPAESMNALTVGAWHSDGVPVAALPAGKFYPYPGRYMPNVSSALGLGHKRSVKPDVLMPGGREHLTLQPGSAPATVRPHPGSMFGGINVAAPGAPGGPLASASWTVGSSAAAAMATHAAHRAYEELEREYPDDFAPLPGKQKASLLKALAAHPARWLGADEFITAEVVPAGTHWDASRREVARHIGYGFVSPDDVVACAADRATMWAAGTLLPEEAKAFSIPLPAPFSASGSPREVIVTLAWLSPVRPGRQLYRAVKLRAAPLGDTAKANAGVDNAMEPPWQQTEGGTLIHRRWSGSAFGQAGANGSFGLQVQREKDQGEPLDDAVPFGLVVTVAMPDNDQIYEEILNRVAVKPASLVPIHP